MIAARYTLATGLATLVAGVGQQALAQEQGEAVAGGRAWSIVPTITVQETFTDNASLGQARKESDQITEVSPGVRIDGNTKRLKLHFDYALRELYYARGTRDTQTQNSLNTFGKLEAVENLLFVDMSGAITRQNISAFGSQSAGNYSVNANNTETASFRISPYLKGRFANYADYELRYSRSAVRAKSSVASDSDTDEWLAKFGGNTPFAALGWSADASRQNYDYSRGRKSESDRLRGFLTYRVNPQVKLSASAGRESNDFLAVNKRSWNTYGMGADWNPNERTQVSAFREKRFFGYGHNFSVNHRLQRSSIRYTDVKDISASPNQVGSAGFGTYYDLLFTQLASSIPDPVARAAQVNALLVAAGIAPNVAVNGGFLNSQPSARRNQELAWLLRGARNTVTLAAVRSKDDRLGAGLGTGDDFSVASSITQKGFNVGWSHQLSPQTALSVTGTHSRSSGQTSGQDQSTTQKAFSASLSTKLGPKTNAALTARRTEFDRTTQPYTENAVIGSVSIQF
jgi:uncharacterized protein (PEP-CTERM system associated)